ncbi:MAG TPA: PilC/PilY family type IV pilus protein [Mariprofundaceae bacterium]|nr:PilC/PilY family type IV pilus protein [Mariprofundaceae bacterium]
MITEKIEVKFMGLYKIVFLALLSLMLFVPGHALAVDLNLARFPGSIGNTSEPNVMFTLDDSGSMGWETLPDKPLSGVSSSSNFTMWPGSRAVGFDETFSWTAAYLRSKGNGVYYDPKVRYDPWLNSDGTSFPNANPACAKDDPMGSATNCRPFAVTAPITASVRWLKDNGSYNNSYTNQTYWPATYFVYTGPVPTGNGANTPAYPADTNAKNTGLYTKVEVRPTVTSYTLGGPERTDCAISTACTYTEEIQNFANWYTYYRSRVQTAKAGVGHAFALQGTSIRVGYGTINTGSRTVDGVTTGGVIKDGVRHFAGADRTLFFTELYNETVGNSTPLRRAVDHVGQYFKRTDNRGPWSDVPGNVNTTADSACRQSFNILMTDGYWNGSTPSVSGNIDNTSHTATTTPSTYTYTPVAPYKDAASSTLADVAMYYWNHDLRTDLNNFVEDGSGQDPAYWQHLVNYTVSLGINGTLDSNPTSPTYDYPGLLAGTTSWPNATSNSPTGIDDLWHAAVNSRGLYFSAKNPTEFAAALTTALSDIQGRTGSAAAVALDGAPLAATSRYVYQTKYYSKGWTGNLFAKRVDLVTGAVALTPAWDAQSVLSAQNWDTGRAIVTYKPGTGGVPFRWTNLSPAQQAFLKINPDTGVTDPSVANAQNRLNWLRGSPVAGMRSRNNLVTGQLELLGDIVTSSPVYVGAPNTVYPAYWGATGPENSVPYAGFQAAKANRAERVYVGANDGMLHAFNGAIAGGGNEVFAYVPNAVMKKLTRLTSTTYTAAHQYFVNESPVARDVFYAGAWHTVLVGGLGGGGQGIYALDVTDPAAANETAAAAKVLWEFDDSADADLGFTYGKPSVVRMRNGRWAAIFGNGYNNMTADGAASATGDAIVYVLDIETGAVIKKFDTGKGLADSTTVPKYANGIANVAAISANGDMIADYLYAGDLQGNVWKMDVTDPNPANWTFSYRTAAALTSPAVPLFVATDSTGVRQPITGGIDVARNASHRSSYIVYFGTGKDLEQADYTAVGQQTQSFYGIWDNGKSGIGRGHLLQQKVLEEIPAKTDPLTGITGFPSRVTSNNSIIWHTGAGLPSGAPPADHMGWYIDLANSDTRIPFNNKGERYLETPVVLNGRVIFVSSVPSTEPCKGVGSGWLFELDAESGSRLSQTALDVNNNKTVDAHGSSDMVQSTIDINGDGVVDSNDMVVASGINVQGSKMTVAPDARTKFISGLSGGLEIIKEDPGPGVTGRQSWIQLQ